MQHCPYLQGTEMMQEVQSEEQASRTRKRNRVRAKA